MSVPLKLPLSLQLCYCKPLLRSRISKPLLPGDVMKSKHLMNCRKVLLYLFKSNKHGFLVKGACFYEEAAGSVLPKPCRGKKQGSHLSRGTSLFLSAFYWV